MINNNRLMRIRKRIKKKFKRNKYNKVILKFKDGLYMYSFSPTYKVGKIEELPTDNNYEYDDLSNEDIFIDDVSLVSNGETEVIIIIDDYGE